MHHVKYSQENGPQVKSGPCETFSNPCPKSDIKDIELSSRSKIMKYDLKLSLNKKINFDGFKKINE